MADQQERRDPHRGDGAEKDAVDARQGEVVMDNRTKRRNFIFIVGVMAAVLVVAYLMAVP